MVAGFLWGCSSVGRAPALQAGGQEFESLHLHEAMRRKRGRKMIVALAQYNQVSDEFTANAVMK